MGADIYTYTVPFHENPSDALEKAKESIFELGNYVGVEHGFRDIEDVVAEMAESGGTGTLLDVQGIGKELGYATMVCEKNLQTFFGTTKPTKSDIESTDVYFDGLERGECRFFTIYSALAKPEAYLFYGLSWD